MQTTIIEAIISIQLSTQIMSCPVHPDATCLGLHVHMTDTNLEQSDDKLWYFPSSPIYIATLACYMSNPDLDIICHFTLFYL